jgi:hypothetical protein
MNLNFRKKIFGIFYGIYYLCKKVYYMKNYYEYWYKRFIKDGLKASKMIIGLGLSVGLGYSVNLPIGILFFMWVLVESLIDRN